jgi:murein DD-endopeptidase MepM/ murein hydrolase activator NlpD
MVPVKKLKTPFAALFFLVVGASGLAGCETAPADTADYWPQAQAQTQPNARATYLTVVVHNGDTISEIAARYSVSIKTVERMNDLAFGDPIHPGETLRLPAGSQQTRKAVLAEAVQPHYESWNAPGAKPSVTVRELAAPVVHRTPQSGPVQPKSKSPALDAALADEASQEIAKATTARSAKKKRAIADTAVPAAPAKPTASKPAKPEGDAAPKGETTAAVAKAPEPVVGSAGVFEWPVEGKIIARFGKDGGGARNDGINIAADLGTPIHAAAAGTVTYAGNELKSYGNLILIKHDNGYVTAYAHAQRLAVSRGDQGFAAIVRALPSKAVVSLDKAAKTRAPVSSGSSHQSLRSTDFRIGGDVLHADAPAAAAGEAAENRHHQHAPRGHRDHRGRAYRHHLQAGKAGG